MSIPKDGPKVTSLMWHSLDNQLITGHDNGDIVQWDVRYLSQFSSLTASAPSSYCLVIKVQAWRECLDRRPLWNSLCAIGTVLL